MQQPGPSVGALYALELVPKEATRKSTVNLRPTGFELTGVKIEWLMNGRPYTTLVPTQFDGADAAKGAAIQARVVVQGREVLSDIVQIVNAPPEITRVQFLLEVFKPGDTLSVEVAGNDIDEDKVAFLYEWTKNGEPAGQGSAIGAPLKRGDKVSVRITPFDGESYGTPVVFPREIPNLPPMIVDHKDFTFDGTVYTYQVRASDPDGDTLVYSLEPPLSGMTLDPSSGLLKWVVPVEFKGTRNIGISVSDGHGGRAKYSIEPSIQ